MNGLITAGLQHGMNGVRQLTDTDPTNNSAGYQNLMGGALLAYAGFEMMVDRQASALGGIASMIAPHIGPQLRSNVLGQNQQQGQSPQPGLSIHNGVELALKLGSEMAKNIKENVQESETAAREREAAESKKQLAEAERREFLYGKRVRTYV